MELGCACQGCGSVRFKSQDWEPLRKGLLRSASRLVLTTSQVKCGRDWLRWFYPRVSALLTRTAAGLSAYDPRGSIPPFISEDLLFWLLMDPYPPGYSPRSSLLSMIAQTGIRLSDMRCPAAGPSGLSPFTVNVRDGTLKAYSTLYGPKSPGWLPMAPSLTG